MNKKLDNFIAEKIKREERDNLIINKIKAGYSLGAIAKEMGLTKSLVQSVKRRNYAPLDREVITGNKLQKQKFQVNEILGFLYTEYARLDDERNKTVLLCKFGDIYLELSKQVLRIELSK